jgi:hypothetical protein
LYSDVFEGKSGKAFIQHIPGNEIRGTSILISIREYLGLVEFGNLPTDVMELSIKHLDEEEEGY